MSIYEIMFILDPEMGQEAKEKFSKRLDKVITKGDGSIINMEDQGMKALAYKINKKGRGNYFLGYFEAPGALISELERILRIDENVMRFIIVKQDDKATRADFEKKAPVVEEPAEAVVEEPKAEEAAE